MKRSEDAECDEPFEKNDMMWSNSGTRRGKRAISRAVTPLLLVGCPSIALAQLSVVSFNNTTASGVNFTLNTSTNNSSSFQLNMNELVDVNHPATTSLTGIGLAIHSSLSTLTTVTVGAIAFDATTNLGGINFDANSTATAPPGGFSNGTLILAGGNTGTVTPLTGSGDLITVTSAVAGTVNFGRNNYGELFVVIPNAGGNFNVASNGTLLFSDYASLTGSGPITVDGGGTVAFNGTNTFTSTLTVTAGTLSIGTTAALGAAPSTPTNFFNVAGGTLEFTGNATTTPFNVNRSVILGTTASGGVGTIGISTTHTDAFSGAFKDSPGGAGTLAKIDTGTIVLNSGNSSYTGGTLINGGLLIANNTSGSATGSGAVMVGDGASNAGSLGGNGFVASDVTITKTGFLAPGIYGGTSSATYAPGALTVSSHNLTLAAGSTLIEKLGASTYDQTLVTGGGNIIAGDGSSATTVNLTLVDVGGGAGLYPGETFVIAQSTAGAIVNFANLTFNITSSTLNASQFTAVVDPTDTEIVLTSTAPEPVSMSFILIGAGTLLRRRRRASSLIGVQVQPAETRNG